MNHYLSNSTDNIFKLYEKLISPIDKIWERYLTLYSDNIKCQPGCISCCEKDITFFPIEIYYIAYSVKKDPKLIKIIKKLGHEDNKYQCQFLYKERCMIYRYRPFLCRTFGLPILYKEEKKFLLDICNKNLNGIDINDIDIECVLSMDLLNEKLVSINQLFSNLFNIDMKKRYTARKVFSLIQS